MLLNVETYHLPRKTPSNNDGGTLEIWGDAHYHQTGSGTQSMY